MFKQIDIFGNEVSVEVADPPEEKERRGRPKRATMNEIWGTFEGKKCGDCKHFLRINYHGRTYFKCDLWALSHSNATDKQVRDMACKRWEEKRYE